MPSLARLTWAMEKPDAIVARDVGAIPESGGESLCEAVDLRAGLKVLDVSPGGSSCSLAAVCPRCEVTSIDTAAAGFPLPFANGAFDIVLSSFGVTCAPNGVRLAHELLRVCRTTGRIGLAMWTPNGFMGRLLEVVGRHAGWRSTIPSQEFEDQLENWFRMSVCDLHTTYRDVVFRHRSPEDWVDALQTIDGPVQKVFAGLPREARRRLGSELLYLIDDFNIGTPSTVVVHSQYAIVVVLKK